MVSGLAAPAASLAAAASPQAQGLSQRRPQGGRPSAHASLRSSLNPSRRLGSSLALAPHKLALPWAAVAQAPEGRKSSRSAAAVAMAADGDTPGQAQAPGGFPASGPGSPSGGSSPASKNPLHRSVAAGAAPGNSNTMIRSDPRHEKLMRMQKELLEQVGWRTFNPPF